MNLSNSDSNNSSSIGNNFIEEMGITVAAQDLTPTMVSQDFLKFSGIVPQDWELSQQPVLNPGMAQLSFKNGISINAQPRSITFNEAVSNKKLGDISIPTLAAKYIEKLPHANYIGLSCNPKMLLPFPDNPQAARQYISEKLLGQGSWKEIGTAPVQAGLNLVYRLERCQFNLNIAEARLQQPQKAPMLAILFAGSFSYGLSETNVTQEKLNQLAQALNFWQTDLKDFRDIVTSKFLSSDGILDVAQEASVFPI